MDALLCSRPRGSVQEAEERAPDSGRQRRPVPDWLGDRRRRRRRRRPQLRPLRAQPDVQHLSDARQAETSDHLHAGKHSRASYRLQRKTYLRNIRQKRRNSARDPRQKRPKYGRCSEIPSRHELSPCISEYRLFLTVFRVTFFHVGTVDMHSSVGMLTTPVPAGELC